MKTNFKNITRNLRKLKLTAFENENIEESEIRKLRKRYAETLFNNIKDELVIENVSNKELVDAEIIAIKSGKCSTCNEKRKSTWSRRSTC